MSWNYMLRRSVLVDKMLHTFSGKATVCCKILEFLLINVETCILLCSQVFLVRKVVGKDSGTLYAMKVLKKATLKGIYDKHFSISDCRLIPQFVNTV